ncbi:hypothetical protein VIGAN_06013400 [Vigna angularis var. angularis]|uniref:40S ribosomal protein SA n=1 Tax=Vigna angularis var. angularis TaxID=157739 RepID=A0A0S3S8Q6_PHAAN|nr:hypothetical protein VIGAN_06013400 [Vigna angularis var. angularis]
MAPMGPGFRFHRFYLNLKRKITENLSRYDTSQWLMSTSSSLGTFLPIKEGALGNIPTIAFYDTDSPMRYVDIGIPTNNKGKHTIGCLFWLLARMVLQMRGTIRPGLKWDVMVDLFFYREPEEAKQQEEEEASVGDYAITDYNPGVITADGQWPGTIDQSWTNAVPQPIPAVPGVNWGAPPSTDASLICFHKHETLTTIALFV